MTCVSLLLSNVVLICQGLKNLRDIGDILYPKGYTVLEILKKLIYLYHLKRKDFG